MSYENDDMIFSTSPFEKSLIFSNIENLIINKNLDCENAKLKYDLVMRELEFINIDKYICRMKYSLVLKSLTDIKKYMFGYKMWKGLVDSL